MKRAAVAAIVLSVMSGACALLTSFDHYDDGPRSEDGGGDASSDAPAPADGGAGACAHRRWPEPGLPGSETQLGERIGAVDALHILDDDDGGVRGFDLDGLCTCPDQPACRAGGTQMACDVPGLGIDNAAIALFKTFQQTGIALNDDGLQLGLRGGHFGIVLRLLGWNGDADDGDVTLQVLNALAVNRDAGDEARFDGNDTWVIDRADFADPIATYSSEKAYVSGGVLVATFARLDLKSRILTGSSTWTPIDFILANAVVTGRVTPDGGLTVSDGIFAGRMLGDDVLAQTLRFLGCVDSEASRSFQALVCNARDLPAKVGDDGTGVACESISVAMGFDAKGAKRGATEPNRDPDACAAPPRCP